MWLLLALNLVGKIGAVLVVGASPGGALALWFVPDVVLAYPIFMPHARGSVRAPRRFATAQREVWLTIDDGPDPDDTPRLLELLAAHGARATFFVIGRRAAAHPDLIRAIVRGGHEVAHHTHTHPVASFWCASPTRQRRELDAGLEALRALGVAPTRFRAPAGQKPPGLRAVLRSRNLTCIGWMTRGLERSTSTPERVADRVLRGLAPGNIFLLHEGPAVPPEIRVHGVRLVLERLTQAGFRCVVPTPDQLVP